MPKQVIYCENVATPRAPHCHATKIGGLVFVSGTTPFAKDRSISVGNFADQMRQTMANLSSILADSGSSLDKVVKVNVFLDRVSDFQEMNEIYKEFFGADPQTWPARTTVQARLPVKDFLLEIECVAEAI
ncbi:RidA family protein [Pelagibacterium sediminicola]|uniref:RidA family protein n=1 Tax=Pelagibacterium sediminicola TaxID=2248761 RepID=UPI000E30C9F4|nr:RidA family protein [Pelagibacterium sediminicola]